MHNFLPSKTGIELFQLDALALTDLVKVLSEKIENSSGLTRQELDFWTERMKLLFEVAESDLGFLKVSERLAQRALLN